MIYTNKKRRAGTRREQIIYITIYSIIPQNGGKTMTKMLIDNVTYFTIDEAARRANITETTLRGYLKSKTAFPEIREHARKVGATKVISESGIDLLNSRKNGKTIFIGNLKFETQKEAADFLGLNQSVISHYIQVKKAIEKMEEKQQ